MSARNAQAELRKLSKTKQKLTAGWFFKTDDGCYGAHDRFIGVKVPDTRLVAKVFKDLSLPEIQKLIRSKIHEDRLLALIILVNRAKKSSRSELDVISKFYLKNLPHVNNWDLVDVSAEYLLGAELFIASEARALLLLKKLAHSKDIWQRRISIIATFYFLKRHRFTPTLEIATILRNDHEDLIHKAVGWMLREMGKRNLVPEKQFLNKYYKQLPRTMLRYAIEKFPEAERQKYLKAKI